LKNRKLSNSLLKNTLYFSVSKYSSTIATLLITGVLARKLEPIDFGTIAIALIFVRLFNLIGNLGIGPAIVQRNDLSDEDVKSLFNYTLLLGVVVAFSFFFSAQYISAFYEIPSLEEVLKLITISIIFASLKSVPYSLLRKSMRFVLLSKVEIIVVLVSGTLAILLAFLDYGIYALIFQNIIASILRFSIYMYYSRFIWTPTLTKESIKKVQKFSANMILFNVVNYFTRNIDGLLIGKYLGSTALGYYDNAYKGMSLPIQKLTHSITPVVMPSIAKKQQRITEVQKLYGKVVQILVYIGFPLSVLLFMNSDDVINTLYGKNWSDSIAIFNALSVSIGFQMILSSSGSLFQGIDRTDLQLKTGLFGSGIIIASILVTVNLNSSLTTIASVISAGYIIYTLVTLWVLDRYVFDCIHVYPLVFNRRTLLVNIILIIALKCINTFVPNLVSFPISILLMFIAIITQIFMDLELRRSLYWKNKKHI
jgi:PST family polysaccharide transporter